MAYQLAFRRQSLALELANVSSCSSYLSQAANEESRLKGLKNKRPLTAGVDLDRGSLT